MSLSTSWDVHCRNSITRPCASAKRKDATPTSPSMTHSCGEDVFMMPFEKLKHFNHGSESQSWILRTCDCDRGSHYVHKVLTVRWLDHSPSPPPPLTYDFNCIICSQKHFHDLLYYRPGDKALGDYSGGIRTPHAAFGGRVWVPISTSSCIFKSQIWAKRSQLNSRGWKLFTGNRENLSKKAFAANVAF